MSKKGVKIATTYFVTIFISLILIGGVGFYFLHSYLYGSDDEDDTSSVKNTLSATTGEYTPDPIDDRTVLGIYSGGQKETSMCLILFRYMPSEAKVMLVPLQPDITVNYNGEQKNLYNVYGTAGSAQVVRCVEDVLGIGVEKYVTLDDTTFKLFTDYCGNVAYEIPYNLVYESENDSENTIIKQGQQLLNFTTLKKVLTFPEYKNGEEERAKIVGEIITLLMNNGSKSAFINDTQKIYQDLVNLGSETNITIYDLEDNQDAIEYINEHNSKSL